MKVDGPGKSSGTKGVSKTGAKKGASSTSFGGMLDDTEEAEGQKPVSGAMSVGQLDALLSLQESGGGTSEEARKRAKQRAALLLDHLDQVRLGILHGGIPVAALQQLTTIVGSHRDKIMDPRLSELLDEIDLRVQVELAKHSMRD
ncbi:MAG TPA: flagellar assembly protein FliX [Patescibacteria group bacterium]|nr:flagellar assembly protein FliX [Patescibacteria group bacterium]